jgi:hypothetical protein
MTAKLVPVGLVCVVFVAVVGCRTAPTSPTPPPPSSPTPPSSSTFATRIALSGTTSSSGTDDWHKAWMGMVPGETAQFRATVLLSDGTTRDATADTRWYCSEDTAPGIVTIVSPGVVRAQAPGWVRVVAEYRSRGIVFASTFVRVAPEGVFLLTVGVDDGQEPIDFWGPFGYISDARVQITSRAGTFNSLTDAYGSVTLPAVGETVLEVQKDGFESVRTMVIVTGDRRVHYVMPTAGSAHIVARTR